MNMNFSFNNPTNLIFGSGRLNELGKQKMPGKKALLLISSGNSVKKYGTLACVEEQLKQAQTIYVICANIHENPSKEVVMEAAAVAKENQCDFIVALGGGAGLCCRGCGYGDQSRRFVGLCERRDRKGAAACESGASDRDHCHKFRNRFRN